MQQKPLKAPARHPDPEVKKMTPEIDERDAAGDWTHPCRDCVFRGNEDGCALGCSLLLIWTGRKFSRPMQKEKI